MNAKWFFAVFAILLVAASDQQPLQRERDPNSMVTFYGGSGSQLLQQCQAALKTGTGSKVVKTTDMQETVDGTFCRGYVVGVVDALIGVSFRAETVYCIPANADNDQFIRIVVKYLSENPATLNYPAGALVSKAIIGAFPCK